VTLANVHLTFVSGWNTRQLRRRLGVLRTATCPSVLMGDLNVDVRRATRVSGLQPLALAPTMPVNEPVTQLDHIPTDDVAGLAGSGGVGAAHRLLLSDHRALSVDF
jgi:endonuclease/exonuclease/phosphatase family metal-dependent hydrolase